MRHKIVHQKQPTRNCCTSTCLAMILNRPVQEVYDEFHDHWYNKHDKSVQDYLDALIAGGENISYRTAQPSEMNRLHSGGLYLCTVPSLNVPGGLHHIVIDFRDDKFIVYDPIKGWEGSKFYVGHDEDPDQEGAFVIHTWIKDIEFL